MWLLAADTANRRMVAGVPSFAISDCTWVIFCGMWMCADSTGMSVRSAALSGMSVELAFVASGTRCKRNVFGNLALAVKHCKLCGSKRLLCHFSNKCYDHGRSLFILTAVRAGKPSWYLTHSEGGIGILDFSMNFFRGSTCGNTMNDELGPLLADLERGNWEFVECIFKDSEIQFVIDTEVLRGCCEY